MAEKLTEAYSDVDISVNIVWIPMVATDNEAAAQKMSGLFPDARVRQFWDANRTCGTAFARDVFQGWARQAFSDLSEEDRSRATLYVHADAPLEQWPAWDIVLFYERGIEWRDHPPTPVHWVCQHEFHGKQKDGTSGLFWKNNFTAKPFASDFARRFAHSLRVVFAIDVPPTLHVYRVLQRPNYDLGE